MQQKFTIFIQHHNNGYYTASVLTHPAYAVYGEKQQPLRDELAQVLGRELATKNLVIDEPVYFENLRHRSMRLELRAVQNNRLILVPMRFTIVQRPVEDEEDLFEVRIPRLDLQFRILGEDNIDAWCEERIRGFFHLTPVHSLLPYQYQRNERIETLDVVYHGPGRYKVRQPGKDHDLDSYGYRSPLETVGVNLSEEAKQGNLDRAQYRDDLCLQLLQILAAGHSRSVLLVGPSGVGKTALLHEAVVRMQSNDRVPEKLEETPVWQVSGGRIIAGMKFLGEWQERCLAVVQEVRNSSGILYVDNLLELLTAGSSRTGLNVAQFLLPYIQNGELTVVAEATGEALAQAEHQAPAFVQALRRLPVTALPKDQIFSLLQVYAARQGKKHNCEFSHQAIARALDLLGRFGDAEALPGSGLVLLGQMAKQVPPQKEKYRCLPQDAIVAFARQSGFPQDLIDPDKLLDIEQVRSFFCQRVFGQDHAMELLTNLVTMIKANLNDPQKPLGSFLFMGPTGVGKTESALTLADYLFGDRQRVIRLDMSEYSNPGSGQRLLGVGGQGELTRKVREQPFSLLLLDEIEKADPSIFDLLLQLLGEGRLTDATGQTVGFSHCVVIMTSNLGVVHNSSIGFGEESKRDIGRHYLAAAEKFFRPELVNRVDFLVPFLELSPKALLGIAKRLMDNAIGREGFVRRGIKVSYDDSLLHLLAQEGFEPRYGARPMKRAVQTRVIAPLSRLLVNRGAAMPSGFTLTVQNSNIQLRTAEDSIELS